MLDNQKPICNNGHMTLPEGPYKAYDLLTDEYLGGYSNPDLAYVKNMGRQITVIYRPSKKRKARRSFP